MNPNRFRCRACRTRRTSFTSLIKHQRGKGHRLCRGGNWRVFVRVKDDDGYLNARALDDIWLTQP